MWTGIQLTANTLFSSTRNVLEFWKEKYSVDQQHFCNSSFFFSSCTRRGQDLENYCELVKNLGEREAQMRKIGFAQIIFKCFVQNCLLEAERWFHIQINTESWKAEKKFFLKKKFTKASMFNKYFLVWLFHNAR